MNAELNGWETRSLRTFDDWAEAIPDATHSILACGLRGALAGLKLGAILGGICGMPFWLLGSLPGVVIGGGAGDAEIGAQEITSPTMIGILPSSSKQK